jgi:hypothetical protein
MIPSYIPSIIALLHSRRQSSKCDGHNQNKKLAVISMKTTPGYDTLYGVSREKEAISKVYEGFYECRQLQQPRVDAVLKAIVQLNIYISPATVWRVPKILLRAISF